MAGLCDDVTRLMLEIQIFHFSLVAVSFFAEFRNACRKFQTDESLAVLGMRN